MNTETIFQKTNKTIGLLCKVQTLLPRAPLIKIYKSFIRPHLDYGDMIYDQTFNMSFQQKMETIQYNAALTITVAIRDSSREKPYQELGLEALQQRRWYRKLCCFYKILKSHSESIVTFKKRILSFIRPSAKSTFNCHNPRGIKLLSRLRLGLGHLREHKFKHSLQDSLNPFCSCGKGEGETSSHYLLHCSNYS